MRRLLLAAFICAATLAFAQSSRHFTFHYETTVNNLENGQPVRVWIPLAHSDEWQTISVKAMHGDLPLRKTRDSQYGNTMLYAGTPKATQSKYHFAVDYDVVRREHIGLSDQERRLSEDASAVTPTLNYAALHSNAQLQRALKPDKLVPTSGRLAELAAQQTAGRQGELQRARALYDYLLATMRYDKTGNGWGRGDAEWACDSKRGNCTDFHSLFMSMARSQHIPSRFEIGFPIPASKREGDIAGYHCWAEFYLYGKGWVPMDISEAWKDQTKREYFFGAHDMNRVQFSMGRDVVLSPPQAGEPLNYFVYPYVEVDGKAYANITSSWSFKDIQ